MQNKAKDVAEAIVENWVLQFGVPYVLQKDHGKNFTSEVNAEMCELLKTDKSRTSPYHPEENRQVERFNRSMADKPSKYCADCPGDWDELLPYIALAYNTSVHKTKNADPSALSTAKSANTPSTSLAKRSRTTEIHSPLSSIG